MNSKFLLLALCLLLLTGQRSAGQNTVYDQNYFGPPLTIPLLLSGSFCELRPNHFHSGLDIKTNGVQGLPVIAVADGYVSRIKLIPTGLGKAVYINHPNGYTSVYGHLSKFNPELDQYVKKQQYKALLNEIDLENIKEGLLKVRKGDTIAWSGNSGGSYAPHLHFEIRETISEWPVNPLLFGFEIKDHIAPLIKKIEFDLDTSAVLKVEYNGKNGTYWRTYTQSVVSFNVYKSNGIYKLTGVKQMQASGKFGLAVFCYDMMNSSSGKLGIYKVQVWNNGILHFSYANNSFSLADTRFINAFTDYKTYVKRKITFQRLFLLPNNRLPFYKVQKEDGYFNLKEKDTANIVVKISDWFENTSLFDVKIIGFSDTIERHLPQIEGQYFKYKTANIYQEEGLYLFLKPYSLYENMNFIVKKKTRKKGCLSPVYEVGDYLVPLHFSALIKIKPVNLPTSLYNKALVAGFDNNDHYWGVGGKYNDSFVETYIRNFGDYCIRVDTVTPLIKTLNFWNGTNVSAKKTLRVKISDNLSGIKNYNAFMDNHWTIIEYDAKKHQLIYTFVGNLSKGEHVFRLEVEDYKANKKFIEYKIYR